MPPPAGLCGTWLTSLFPLQVTADGSACSLVYCLLVLEGMDDQADADQEESSGHDATDDRAGDPLGEARADLCPHRHPDGEKERAVQAMSKASGDEMGATPTQTDDHKHELRGGRGDEQREMQGIDQHGHVERTTSDAEHTADQTDTEAQKHTTTDAK